MTLLYLILQTLCSQWCQLSGSGNYAHDNNKLYLQSLLYILHRVQCNQHPVISNYNDQYNREHLNPWLELLSAPSVSKRSWKNWTK